MINSEINKPLLKPKIAFIDLKAQQQAIRTEIDRAITKVLDHGAYIMGPEVTELESALSKFCGAKYSISCANGTDALALGLMAKNVGPGDAVFVPTFTFAATAEVVAWVGATPVFVGVLPDTFNMDPECLKEAIKTAKEMGLNPSCIIPVDLFGQPADYDAIQTIADENDMWVMADAAQSFGAVYKGRKVGNIGDIATTSFFPAKPLGCYGDGGAIFTNDEEIYSVIKSLRVHGQGKDKYDNVRIGMNGRLDTIQAAILLEKLKVFPDEIKKRNELANFYSRELEGIVQTPVVIEGATSVWAQYTIRLPKGVDRKYLMEGLHEKDVPTMIYYIKPLHLQTAYRDYPIAKKSGLPISEQIANDVLSLPMHPYMGNAEREYIVESIKEVLAR